MVNKYPDYIMQAVRQNLGLKPDDASRDNYIESLSKLEILEKVGRWNNIIYYSQSIKKWVQDIYKVELKED